MDRILRESIRKDVECFFGILKIRFRYLSNPVLSHGMTTIEYAMKTCCILHNMILEYDKGFMKERQLWESIAVNDLDVNDVTDEDLQQLRNSYRVPPTGN